MSNVTAPLPRSASDSRPQLRSIGHAALLVERLGRVPSFDEAAGALQLPASKRRIVAGILESRGLVQPADGPTRRGDTEDAARSLVEFEGY